MAWAVLIFLAPLFSVYATDFTSASFILRDPVITAAGARTTSTSFEYFSSTAQIATGENTSTSFIQRSGFWYFPTITVPVASASAGNGAVDLTWTASVGTNGFVVTSYQVGQATVSGGSYTFTNVGNVTASTRSGLTNGTTYYFVVRTLDGVGSVVATSTQVSAAPVAPTPPAPTPAPSGGGGGGGGGGWQISPVTTVNFSGRAYPKSTVTLLKDAQVAAVTVAGPDARFNISLSGLSAGNYIFSVYGEDKTGERSSSVTFPVSVTAGVTTNVSGIFITPTINVDKNEVKRGEAIAIFGSSTPQSEITISVNSDQEFFIKAAADTDGAYLYNFDTLVLELGQHSAKSRAAYKGEISAFSKAVTFVVSTKSVPRGKPLCGKADLNCDRKVNLIDFSIAAYWYKRTLSPSFAALEKERLNGDGKVTLVDFSIIAYYWTG